MDPLDFESLSLQMQGSKLNGTYLLDANNKIISTIVCCVRLSNTDRIFLLTPAYAFEAEVDVAEGSPEENNDPSTSTESCSDEEEEEEEEEEGNTVIFGDVIYDLDEMMKAREEIPQERLQRRAQADTISDKFIKPHGVWALANDPKYANLHWALVEIEESQQWEASEICEIVTCEPNPEFQENRHVSILTSRGSLYAKMTGSTHTTDDNWNRVVYWDLKVEDQQEHLRLGDGGTLVIDTLNGKLFGYATKISINRNGITSLRVIPLHTVVSQLAKIFNTNVEVFLNITTPCSPKVVQEDIFRELPLSVRQLWPVEGPQGRLEDDVNLLLQRGRETSPRPN